MWVDGVDSILFVTTLLECMEVCMHLSELLYIASLQFDLQLQCILLINVQIFMHMQHIYNVLSCTA